ncbi:hypothetical protein G5I_12812 [Acromyrmex echinatior]|uniref:Uncharacterized protein n=1 Tax=Acromyrmex echinatior TaxID=103372 RepID=F4X3B8_ACREC|nr:hypothetical protein G5I_12812 [Acromyrmex echinatior]
MESGTRCGLFWPDLDRANANENANMRLASTIITSRTDCHLSVIRPATHDAFPAGLESCTVLAVMLALTANTVQDSNPAGRQASCTAGFGIVDISYV